MDVEKIESTVNEAQARCRQHVTLTYSSEGWWKAATKVELKPIVDMRKATEHEIVLFSAYPKDAVAAVEARLRALVDDPPSGYTPVGWEDRYQDWLLIDVPDHVRAVALQLGLRAESDRHLHGHRDAWVRVVEKLIADGETGQAALVRDLAQACENTRKRAATRT